MLGLRSVTGRNWRNRHVRISPDVTGGLCPPSWAKVALGGSSFLAAKEGTPGGRAHRARSLTAGAPMTAKSELSEDVLDVLYGADAIARFVGLPRWRIYHAAAHGHLPIKRIGGTVVARKSELDRALSGAAGSDAA